MFNSRIEISQVVTDSDEGEIRKKDWFASQGVVDEDLPRCAQANLKVDDSSSPSAPEAFPIFKIKSNTHSYSQLPAHPKTAAGLTSLDDSSSPILSVVLCEERHPQDSDPVTRDFESIAGIQQYHQPHYIMKDPIEGRDSEFDVELSSGSSIHSVSIANISGTTGHLFGYFIGYADEIETSSIDQSNEDKPLLDESHHKSGIYGKVVKSIQRSIRKIFHQNKPQDKEDRLHCSDCFVQPASHHHHHNQAQPQASASLTVTHHHHHHHLSNGVSSPITSVHPDSKPVLSTLPIHKTVLIDVYSVSCCHCPCC